MFGKNSGAPVPGMVSMLAGMLGVTPESLQSGVEDIQRIILETAGNMKAIQAGNSAILQNQLVIMTALNCQGQYNDGSSDRGSAGSLGGPGPGNVS